MPRSIDDTTDLQVMQKFRYCRNEALKSREWKTYSENLRTANRMLMGDQTPDELSGQPGENWFPIPLLPGYIAQLSGILTGPQSRVFVRGRKDSMSELMTPVIEARLLETFEENFMPALMNRLVMDTTGRGNSAIIGEVPDPNGPDEYNVPFRMKKVDPGQVWFSPAARGHFHPTFESPYVGYEFLAPRSSVIAEFPSMYEKLKRFKAYGVGQNPITEDRQDPLYSLYDSLRQSGTGPLSLYDYPVRNAMTGSDSEEAIASFAMIRRTRFWWLDTIVVKSGSKTKTKQMWFKAEFAEQESSGSPKDAMLLRWGPVKTKQPEIVLSSNWLNSNSPYGKPIYAMAGSVAAMIDATATMIYREMVTDHQLAEMMVGDGSRITDPRVKEILTAGDKPGFVDVKLEGRSWRDVFGRLDPSANTNTNQMQFIAMLETMLENIVGLPPVQQGRTGTPGQRMSGAVANALQGAASRNQTPQAFLVDAVQTNVGQMAYQFLKEYDYAERYVPRGNGFGGFPVNKNIPLEASDELAGLASAEFPSLNGELAIPNGLRGFGEGKEIIDRPFSSENIDELLGRDDVKRVTVVVNALAHSDVKIGILSEADYQQRSADFIERLAIIEQYRAGSISTETIMKELFRGFPEIDPVSEMENRYGEESADKYHNLPIEVKVFVDQKIDEIMAAQGQIQPGSATDAAPVA